MVDWGFLTPIYNLGAQAGQIVYNAGASVGRAVSTPPPTQQTPAPPAPGWGWTGGQQGSDTRNPVTIATDQFNLNYSYTTPRVGGGVNKYNPTSSFQVQEIGGAPATRSEQPIRTLSDAETMGLPTPFKSVASPAIGSMQSPIDAPRGLVSPVSFSPQKAAQVQTYYVPGGAAGDRSQIAIEKANMVYAPTSGMVGFYQTPKSIYEDQGFVRKYGFETSGGGPGALQSGMFSTQPLTPAVFTQESGGQKFAPSADPLAAAAIIKSPELFSRLGAEAYGGFVQPLDNRTLAPGTEMGRYAQGGNLANLVNPYGTNEPKTSWETVPWQIETKGAPNIQSIDIAGKLSAPMGSAVDNIGGKLPVLQGAAIMGSPLDASKYQTLPLLDEATGLPLPFRSTARDTVEITKPTGDIPYIGQIPFISPALAFFQPEQITTTSKSTTFAPPITTTGPTTTTTKEIGGGYSITKDMGGGVKETTTFSPSTETTTFTPITTTQSSTTTSASKTTEGQTGFTKFIQDILPAPGTTEAQKTIDISMRGLSLMPLIGQEAQVINLETGLIDKYGGSTAKNITGFIPFSPTYMEDTYKNLYKDPGVSITSAAIPFLLVGAGTVLRGAGIGEGILAPTSTGGKLYQGLSTVAGSVLIGLYGSDIMKRTTGVTPAEMTSQFFPTTTKTPAGETVWQSGKGPQGVINLFKENYPGIETTRTQLNRIETQELIPMTLVYSGATAAGSKFTDWVRTRNVPEITNPKSAMYMIDEGYPTHPRITTQDLGESFKSGTITLQNPVDIANTVMQPSGTPIERIPVGTQIGAPAGRSFIYSGAEYPFLNQGFVPAGHSEIPNAMYTSPDGLSYFTKAGSQGGFGITNDILGIYKLPTMYRMNVEKGQYQEIPQNLLSTPTQGMSANDPMNPRNIAINEWMSTTAKPGVPAVGQYGKAEWQFEIPGGSEVSKGKSIGFYQDAGAKILVIEETPTGAKSSLFKPSGISTDPLTGSPMREVGRFYAEGGTTTSTSDISQSKYPPIALSTIFPSETSISKTEITQRSQIEHPELSTMFSEPSIVSKSSYPSTPRSRSSLSSESSMPSSLSGSSLFSSSERSSMSSSPTSSRSSLSSLSSSISGISSPASSSSRSGSRGSSDTSITPRSSITSLTTPFSSITSKSRTSSITDTTSITHITGGLPFGFAGGPSGELFGKGRHVFRESFRVGTGIRFGELGFGGGRKGRRMKL